MVIIPKKDKIENLKQLQYGDKEIEEITENKIQKLRLPKCSD